MREPDEPAAYLVAADWLQQRGDPWGELIGLAVGRTRETDRAAWRAELAHSQRACDPYARDAGHYRVRWTWGVVDRLVYVARSPRAAASELRDLLAAPVARLVRELVILDRGGDLPALAATLAAARLPNLRALRLVALDELAQRREGIDLAALVEPWPHLEQLEVAGRPHGALAHPRLRELALPHAEARDVALADLPALATLRRRGVDHIDALLDEPARLPALRELCVTVDSLDRARALEARVEATSRAAQLYRFDLRVATARGAIADRRFPIDRAGEHRAREPRAAALVAVGDYHARTLYPVHSPFTIGAHPDATLALPDDLLVALHQATIEQARDASNTWELRDHGPEYAARLGGQPIERAPLAAGDELWFGLTSFVFDDDVAL